MNTLKLQVPDGSRRLVFQNNTWPYPALKSQKQQLVSVTRSMVEMSVGMQG